MTELLQGGGELTNGSVFTSEHVFFVEHMASITVSVSQFLLLPVRLCALWLPLCGSEQHPLHGPELMPPF